MSRPVVVIGWLLLVPSFLATAYFGVILVLAWNETGVGSGMGKLVCVILTLIGFAGSVIGWLLTMKRSVLRCGACQSVVDRA